MSKRVFLIVLDSVGVGELPDAAEYGDAGSNTLRAVSQSPKFHLPHLAALGLFNIDHIGCGSPAAAPAGAFGRLAEASKGKDTTTGHWEIAGLISEQPMPTYPDGFPSGLMAELSRRTGRAVLCNKPYSGTAVIQDYGKEQMETGGLIVYTSADSVLQIAAHEDVIPVDELYKICEIARELMQGEHGVGRIIARPFVGEYPRFTRTANRHDYSLKPGPTVLDALQKAGLATIGVGKIYDIFAGCGIGETFRIKNNAEGMERTLELAGRDFEGLCFVNLVDFDMVYGHRNDVDGYANALSEFDRQLGELLPRLGREDILMITADHGCDPSTPSTDHSREFVPILCAGPPVRPGVNLGTGSTYADIAAALADYFNVEQGGLAGSSFLKKMMQ